MKRFFIPQPITGMVRMISAILLISLALGSCKKEDDPGDAPDNGNSFTDLRDGNEYTYVTIGTQVWMAQNLAYLPAVQPSTVGSSTTKCYYVCYYEGTDVVAAKATSTYKTYGVLYNWPAAMDGSASSVLAPSGAQGACPAGWHLPSDEEWKILERYLGMEMDASNAMSVRTSGGVGTKLKAASGWENNGNGDNSSGFTALPGGLRNDASGIMYRGLRACYWSASQYADPIYSWDRYLNDYSNGVMRAIPKLSEGHSVRCIRD